MPLLYSGLRRHLALRVRTRRPGPVDYGRQNHGRQGSAGHQDDHSSIIFRKCGCRFLAYSRHTPRTPYLLHDPGACPALTILFRFLSPVVALLVPRRRCLFRDSFLAACESPTARSCTSSVHSAPGHVHRSFLPVCASQYSISFMYLAAPWSCVRAARVTFQSLRDFHCPRSRLCMFFPITVPRVAFGCTRPPRGG